VVVGRGRRALFHEERKRTVGLKNLFSKQEEKKSLYGEVPIEQTSFEAACPPLTVAEVCSLFNKVPSHTVKSG